MVYLIFIGPTCQWSTEPAHYITTFPTEKDAKMYLENNVGELRPVENDKWISDCVVFEAIAKVDYTVFDYPNRTCSDCNAPPRIYICKRKKMSDKVVSDFIYEFDL